MNRPAALLSCIILAGGRGERAGGVDKGLLPYKKNSTITKPLIEYVIDAVKNQVDDLVISANRNIESYKRYSVNVISDSNEDFHGPLAGIAACLPHCNHERVLVVACDMPNLPANLVTRLSDNLQNTSISIATVKDRHQLALLIKGDMIDSIQRRLKNNQLALIRWVESVPYNTVSFDGTPDAFANLNQLADTL